MAYKGIIARLVEEFEKEGHKAYVTEMREDRAFFNLPPEMKPPNKQEFADETIQGTTRSKRPRDNVDGKQLRLPGSSTIQSAAFWPTKQYLVVAFKSGHTYGYDGVPIDIVQNWEKAVSAGSWFYYNIRLSFPYKKL